MLYAFFRLGNLVLREDRVAFLSGMHFQMVVIIGPQHFIPCPSLATISFRMPAKEL
ncbi:hypothetical protein DSECCO2_256590 [anaerobic digester metagenome]